MFVKSLIPTLSYTLPSRCSQLSLNLHTDTELQAYIFTKAVLFVVNTPNLNHRGTK